MKLPELPSYAPDLPLGPPRIGILCGLFLANYFFPSVAAGSIPPGSAVFPWVCAAGTLLFLLAGLAVCASAGSLPEVLALRVLPPRTLRKLARWTLVVFLAGAAAGGIWTAILTRLHYPVAPQELQQMIRTFPGTWARLGFFVQITVVIPAFEELVFRRSIHELLLPWGALPALLGTAVLFSAVHLYLPGAVTLFLYGVAFQLVFSRTRSLCACWLLHGALNGISFLLCITL